MSHVTPEVGSNANIHTDTDRKPRAKAGPAWLQATVTAGPCHCPLDHPGTGHPVFLGPSPEATLSSRAPHFTDEETEAHRDVTQLVRREDEI